jgi:hypothetical protein
VLQTAASTYHTTCIVTRSSDDDTTIRRHCLVDVAVCRYGVRQKRRPRMIYKRICRVAAGDVYDGGCCRSSDGRQLARQRFVASVPWSSFARISTTLTRLYFSDGTVSRDFIYGGAMPLLSVGRLLMSSRPQSSRRYGGTPIIAKDRSVPDKAGSFLHSIE